MAIEEVFPNPLVKSVVFQITFPSLFFLESRIGEFQIKIMKRFPVSQLLIQRQMLIMIGESEAKEKLPEDMKRPEEVKRIWRFVSEQGVKLDVTLDSLSLLSETHKSYNLGDGPKFRDAIEFVCRSFIEVTQLPVVKRVGLRYIDKCPVPEGSNDVFLSHYNSGFPLSRFSLEDATEMQCKVAVKRNSHMLRYAETLESEGASKSLILDFDAWSVDIEPSHVVEVTDSLHQIIQDEFVRTVKEPVVEYMRRKPEIPNA